jgi:hypothetical protein
MWFLLNAAMLMISTWFITDGWSPRARLIAFIAAPLFFPIFGALIVGQYVFPVILGMAMLAYALRNKHVTLSALGMALVTFKPHVGIFVLLGVALHLFLRRDEFGRRALRSIVLTGVILFLLGFLADGNWLVNYWKSLFAFKDVSACKLCVSLPVTIAELAGFGFNQAFLVSLVLLIGFTLLFIRLFPKLTDRRLVGLYTCMALLVNPYLQNYDFAFAVIPLFVFAGLLNLRPARFVALLAFVLPWIGFVLWGREGNFMLLLSTIILMTGLARDSD